MNELKNMQSTGLTTMGPALKYTFDLLNVNRMTSGIDTYGQVVEQMWLVDTVDRLARCRDVVGEFKDFN